MPIGSGITLKSSVLAILALDITILTFILGVFSRSLVPASTLLPLQSGRVHTDPAQQHVRKTVVCKRISMHEVSTVHRFGDEV